MILKNLQKLVGRKIFENLTLVTKKTRLGSSSWKNLHKLNIRAMYILTYKHLTYYADGLMDIFLCLPDISFFLLLCINTIFTIQNLYRK